VNIQSHKKKDDDDNRKNWNENIFHELKRRNLFFKFLNSSSNKEEDMEQILVNSKTK